VSCPRTHCEVPDLGLNPNCSIRSRASEPWGHQNKENNFLTLGKWSVSKVNLDEMSLTETSLDKLDFAWNKGIRLFTRYIQSKHFVISKALLPHSLNYSRVSTSENQWQNQPYLNRANVKRKNSLRGNFMDFISRYWRARRALTWIVFMELTQIRSCLVRLCSFCVTVEVAVSVEGKLHIFTQKNSSSVKWGNILNSSQHISQFCCGVATICTTRCVV